MAAKSRFSVISKDKLQTYDNALLGSGGFGFVVKAKHVDWSLDVAVKCVCSKQTMTEKQQKDLYLEAEKLEAARFKYVIHFYGMCIEPTFYCLIMDLAENGSLKVLLGVDIPWPLRWRIAFETAVGMNFLHNLAPRILHCDLKSENILLDEEYHVKGSKSSVSFAQAKLADLKLEEVVRHFTGGAAPQLDEAVPIQVQSGRGGQYQPQQSGQGGQYQPQQSGQGGQYQTPPVGGAWGGGEPQGAHNIPGVGAGMNINMESCQNVIIGDDPERPVTNKMFQAVSAHIGREWKKLARELDLTEPQIDQVQYDYHHEGLLEITYQMMIKWKQQNGKQATVGKLAQAFGNIGKGYLAKDL
uniref:Protein kinase domain-containing protein n=1 Tax=Branchiostoma floridae TaxID=7739 RepID=C3XTV3_BRAFL|eukprot:XP_002612318.1 hypothetical protein BRAFLDRAFT_80066 [Branchiostoma floridae]